MGHLLAPFGLNFLWPRHELNVSEAAAARDEAQVVRFLEAGGNADVRWNVRAGLVSDTADTVTPLEAAVAVDDAEMVRRILARRAPMDADMWVRLQCLAEGDVVTRLLDERRPPQAVARCEGSPP